MKEFLNKNKLLLVVALIAKINVSLGAEFDPQRKINKVVKEINIIFLNDPNLKLGAEYFTNWADEAPQNDIDNLNQNLNKLNNLISSLPKDTDIKIKISVGDDNQLTLNNKKSLNDFINAEQILVNKLIFKKKIEESLNKKNLEILKLDSNIQKNLENDVKINDLNKIITKLANLIILIDEKTAFEQPISIGNIIINNKKSFEDFIQSKRKLIANYESAQNQEENLKQFYSLSNALNSLERR